MKKKTGTLPLCRGFVPALFFIYLFSVCLQRSSIPDSGGRQRRIQPPWTETFPGSFSFGFSETDSSGAV
ncbi:MAG TPA: hypothetical protein DCP64_06150, partial [Sarcina sp.]|nr:hypothetical protein [Sarcina sp.]